MSSVVKRPAFVLIGAPGSGKGTQGKILGTIPRFFHFACGDVFRSLDTRTKLGQKFVEYSSRGELVPDELTVELWETQMNNFEGLHMYKPDIDFLVLDGIPRNQNQARLLDERLQVHQVFHLSCPNREELARRIRKRALKENRLDDASNSIIENRIAAYEDETKPIIDYYDDSIVTDIDATQHPMRVMNNIMDKIMSLDAFIESEKLVF